LDQDSEPESGAAAAAAAAAAATANLPGPTAAAAAATANPFLAPLLLLLLLLLLTCEHHRVLSQCHADCLGQQSSHGDTVWLQALVQGVKLVSLHAHRHTELRDLLFLKI
jgi:hypothetical protein